MCADWFKDMVDENTDHENDEICNATSVLLDLTILQWKIREIPLKIFCVIVKKIIDQTFSWPVLLYTIEMAP